MIFGLNYGISEALIWDDELWRKYFFRPSRDYRFSVQGWIDMYNYLVEIGEMDFIKDLKYNFK